MTKTVFYLSLSCFWTACILFKPGWSEDGSSRQRPYLEQAWAIPGRIEIEHYDEGGEGVAYHDTSPGNSGRLLRKDDVDIAPGENKGHAVGWSNGGEWLEYTVDVEAGTYDVDLRAASARNGSLVVKIGCGQWCTLGTFRVGSTGSYDNYVTLTLKGVAVGGGKQTLRLELLGDSDLFDLDWIVFRKAEDKPPAEVGDPIGVNIHWDTLQRKGIRGDNWTMTWAADDNLYTLMDDGCGFRDEKTYWNCLLIRIAGGPDFTTADTWECPGWPYHPHANQGKGFYGYGTYAVGNRIFTWVWKSEHNGYSRPIANRLIYTDDFGQTFQRWDGTPVTKESFAETSPESFFFHKEQPTPRAGRDAYAFNWIAFCQNGQANSAAKDDYVYMYAVEQYDVRKLGMIRVHKDKLCDKSAYEYLVSVDGDGKAGWSSNPAERGTTYVFPERNYNGVDWLWCSWYPSVVYNAGLDRYLMVSYGISDDRSTYWSGWCRPDSESAATVIMLHSRNPWGPWNRFYQQSSGKRRVKCRSSGASTPRPAARTSSSSIPSGWKTTDGPCTCTGPMQVAIGTGRTTATAPTGTNGTR